MEQLAAEVPRVAPALLAVVAALAVVTQIQAAAVRPVAVARLAAIAEQAPVRLAAEAPLQAASPPEIPHQVAVAEEYSCLFHPWLSSPSLCIPLCVRPIPNIGLPSEMTYKNPKNDRPPPRRGIKSPSQLSHISPTPKSRER